MNDNEYDQMQPPKTSGMGCAVKIILGIVIGGVLCAALCCGGMWYLSTQAVQMTEDPGEIRKFQAEIVDINIPPDMPPTMGGKFNLGMFKMQMAGFGEEQGKFLITIVSRRIKELACSAVSSMTLR